MCHEKYMRRCFQLARNGEGQVSPNPLVGSVIVEEGDIIGEGFHRKYGTLHAERQAMASVKDKSCLKNSTLYVNLEPCNHQGKTPPCTHAIIESGIPRVVIANTDPHKVVAGKGIAALEASGIEVIQGVLANEGFWLNRRFFTFHKQGRPFITLKWAESADGFIDIERSSNEEKPTSISGAEAQFFNHKWRAKADAILVGARTALLDIPALTARMHYTQTQPRRVILDPKNRLTEIPIVNWTERDLLFQTEKKVEMAIAISSDDFLNNMLEKLRELNVLSLFVEGGAKTHHWFYNEGLWDEMKIFHSNKVNLGKGVSSLKTNLNPNSTFSLKEDQLSIIKNTQFKHF